MTAGKESGFTFNEVLVAMNIAVIAVMSYSLGSANLIRRQVASDNSTIAIHLAQDKIEELQARRPLTDVTLCPSGGDHGLSAKSGIAGVFDRCWTIANSLLASDLKQIDVIVSWRDHEFHQVKLTTLIHLQE
jgi:Tfp pilus assembly protein FimT